MGSKREDSPMTGPVVCVFCGTWPGKSPAHLQAARSLAEAFHKHNIRLVFGGSTTGLMGEVASTLVSLSGPDAVHGIIPKALMDFERRNSSQEDMEINSTSNFGRVTVVPSMHDRKQTMVDEVLAGGPGSGFVALSGGYGTLEELMEMVTWNQLGIHDKPVVVFNVDGYWDGLLHWVKKAVGDGFVSEGNAHILGEAKSAEEVVDLLQNYKTAKGQLDCDWGNGS